MNVTGVAGVFSGCLIAVQRLISPLRSDSLCFQRHNRVTAPKGKQKSNEDLVKHHHTTTTSAFIFLFFFRGRSIA